MLSETIKMLPRYRFPVVEKKRSNKKKTHDEYVQEVKIKNPNVTVIGTYVNATTKILHRCNLCNNEWNTSPDNVLHGHGCKICSQTKTHEQYVLELQEKAPTIKIMNEYAGTKSKNTFCCLICN